jgi:hypothetical protein
LFVEGFGGGGDDESEVQREWTRQGFVCSDPTDEIKDTGEMKAKSYESKGTGVQRKQQDT